MNERIKIIRKNAGLTQEQFAEKVNTSRNYIFLIEKGDRNPGDRLAADICRLFNVNPEWLETGEGSMYQERTRGEEIGDIVRAAAGNNRDEAVGYFTDLLADLSDAEIMLMYEIFKRHYPKK